ncbi:hypothetical protein DL93DRAFT_2084475 [Clavulina sp. PMI_390]|nr:hypothetical protein DL93DRAFT_2084475 [Clavulina sp. PMI_390]
MRQRMLRVLVLSAIFTWGSTSFWVFTPARGIIGEVLASFGWQHLLTTSIIYAFGIVPSFVALRLLFRQEYRSSSPRHYATAAARVWGHLTPAAGMFVALYAVQGWVLAVMYASSTGMREIEDPELSIWIKHSKYHWMLNERWVVLTMSNVVLAMAYAVRALVLSRSADRWPSFTTRPPHRPELMSSLLGSIVPTLIFSATMSVVFTMTYTFSARRTWYTAGKLLPFIRPYMAFFASRKESISIGSMVDLGYRSLQVNILSAGMWELVRVLLEGYMTEPIVMSAVAENPNDTLLSGIVTSDSYVKYHAFHELSVVAQTASASGTARRKALFSDLKTSHPPSAISSGAPLNGVPYATSGAWAVLVREALLILGRDYQTLLRRGASPPSLKSMPAPTPAPAPSAAVPETPAKKPRASVMIKPGGASVFRPAVPASPSAATTAKIVDSFASDGAATSVLGGLVDGATTALGEIPSIFLREGGSAASSSTASGSTVATKRPSSLAASVSSLDRVVKEVEAAPKRSKEAAMRVLSDVDSAILKRLPLPVRFWLSDVRWWWNGSAVERVKGVLRGRKVDLWIIESLSYLTAFSLEEDAYGVVQRDVPRVLEALLAFTVALEAYTKELQEETLKSHPLSELSEERKDEMQLRMDARREEESQAIAELVGPLLTGALFLFFATRSRVHFRLTFMLPCPPHSYHAVAVLAIPRVGWILSGRSA